MTLTVRLPSGSRKKHVSVPARRDRQGRLLEWVERGAVAVAEVPTSAYAEIRSLIRKYADRDIDFADAAIVWLAEKTACRAILTVDVRDFSAFRFGKGKRFELVKCFDPSG